MRIVIYSIRFLLVVLFVYAGIEKLFLPFDPSVFRTSSQAANPIFFEFYELLQGSGFLCVVGFFQLICGVLLVFRRTYLLGSIMLVPLILCLLLTHVFFSQHLPFILFDGLLLALNLFLVFERYQQWYTVLLGPQNKIF